MSRKRKIILTAAILLVTVPAVLFAGLSYYIGRQIVASTTQLVTNETTKNVHEIVWEQEGFDYEAFSRAYTVEKLNLESSFEGHSIPADFIYTDDRNRDVVIMAHGLGGNRLTNYSKAAFFLENGYNVITYDQRSSGENTAGKTTFGYWEKYDLIDCINYAKETAPGKKIGVWGESFGGATAVQAVACGDTQEDVAFLILDCPVSSMEWMVEEEMKGMDLGIPVAYMTWCGNVVNYLELGFSYKDVDSAQIAGKIHIPTLVINSEADNTTPYFMGRDIYDSLAAQKKELWTVPDSGHVGMWEDYNEEYRSRILDLMEAA